jgi:hypothetical protein
MADRRVRQTGKDEDGDITSLCNSGETWSPRVKSPAIADIESKTHRYFVREEGEGATVTVYAASDGKKHLRTVADKSSKNNLDNLPDC